MRLLRLVNPTKKKKKKKKINKYASKICLPTRRGWRFFKNVTWYSPQSRVSPSCPAYPGCHTQAAGLNCRESAYLSNRITRKEYGHICLSESDGPHVGCNGTWHHPADPQGIIRPSHRVQQQQQQALMCRRWYPNLTETAQIPHPRFIRVFSFPPSLCVRASDIRWWIFFEGVRPPAGRGRRRGGGVRWIFIPTLRKTDEGSASCKTWLQNTKKC